MGVSAKAISILILWSAAGYLVGCASTSPSPELLAVTAPGPATVPTISGPALNRCLEELGLRRQEADPAEAQYSQSFTYKFAEKFQNGPKVMQPYATHVRAYVYERRGTNVFGVEGTTKRVCYYDFPNGEPRFLTALSPDKDGRVPVVDLQQATLTAYAIMAGKNPTKVRLFGVYAG
jgi:hypothetical protein